MSESGIKVVSDNRRASFDFSLEERYEAGIVLLGTEIKSIRCHAVNIRDSFVHIKNGEAYIVNANIPTYEKGNIFNHEPTRTRKLLLNKKEIVKLHAKVKVDGYTLVPTKMYLKNGMAKLEIALAKGKKNYDKREDDKKATMKRDMAKALKERY